MVEIVFCRLRLRPQAWQLVLLGITSLGLMTGGNRIMRLIGVVTGVVTTAVATRAAGMRALLRTQQAHYYDMRLAMQFSVHTMAALITGVLYSAGKMHHGDMFQWFILGCCLLNGLLAVVNLLIFIPVRVHVISEALRKEDDEER